MIRGKFPVFLLILFSCPLWAQVTTGSIFGWVYDPAGKPVSGAQVTLADELHPSARNITTDSAGSYRLVGLPPAVYTVSVRSPGFEPTVRNSVTLAVDSQVKVNFHLTIHGIREVIEVTAPAQELQTQSSELGAVLDQQWVETLPLNRRDFLQLSLLTPGVAPPVEGSQLSTRGAFAMHADGGREEYNNFLLDGVDNNDPYVNGYVVEPPVDSIQEFKIATNSYSAEYGRSAAGQVNVITRRGTNDFQGSAYEYLRNKVLDATTFPDPVKAPHVRNQFGAAGGGPIAKKKTYFYANLDFLRDRQGVPTASTVPTEAERTVTASGVDLSSLGTTITDPMNGDAPFPGNIIPANRISPIALDILNLYPQPNRPGTVNNYVGPSVQSENATQGSFRVDQQLSGADSLTFRYSLGIDKLFEPFAECSNCVAGFGDYLDDHTHNAMVQYQHLFGARAVNSLTIGFNRLSRDLLPQNYNADVGQLWNVGWLNLPQRDFGYPAITVGGFSQVGDITSTPDLRHTNTYEMGDGLSLDRGSHLLKMGGEVRRLELNGRLDLLARGSLSFPGYSIPYLFDSSGSGISDLLLGLPAIATQAQANSPIVLRSMAYAGYFQDNWKLRRNLALDLGLRYEYVSPAVDPSDGMSELDLQTMQVVPVGTNGISRSGYRPAGHDFAPRIGVAWNPRSNLAVRAGYGIFYDSGMFIANSAAFFNPPQFNLQTYGGGLTLESPFPAGGGIAPPSLNVLSPNLVTPYLQQWNLSMEESWERIGTLSLGYAGSKGSHLLRERDLNQSLPGASVPFAQYGNIFFIESEGASSFNALEAHFTRRMASAFSIWASYTYSHSIDDASAFLGVAGVDANFPQDSHNPEAERASSSFDMRHHFAVAYVFTLPEESRWTRNTELQGITAIESGQPFTPMIEFAQSNTGNCNYAGCTGGYDRPNLIPGVSTTLAHPTAAEWFNTAAFALPAPNTFGDAGRNSLRGPGYASFDASLLRHFSLTERVTLVLEAQAFNLFNRTNFNLPQAFADQPDFGTITSAKPPRQLQFTARFKF